MALALSGVASHKTRLSIPSTTRRNLTESHIHSGVALVLLDIGIKGR